MINIKIENGKFSKDGKSFIPERKIIEVPLYSEMQQDCYQYNAMDAPSELKKFILNNVADKIDEIIINDRPNYCNLDWLKNKLNSIKITDNGIKNS